MSEQEQQTCTNPHPTSALRMELLEHAPFSVSSAAIGLVFAGILCYLTADGGPADHEGTIHDHQAHLELFHLFHPAHMFFSAAATSAMFWRYDKSASKAIVVGLVGAIGVCGVSDILLPHISLMMMGRQMQLHVCVWENPTLVLPFAAMGVLVGLGASGTVARSTLFSHSLHVIASTMASIFYMIAPFGQTEWFHDIGRIFVFVIIAVMVPCCLSDVVFPLLMTRQARIKAHAAGHAH